MKATHQRHKPKTENTWIRAEFGIKVPEKLSFRAHNDLSIECDVNGIYTFTSQSFRTMLGYEPSELLGKSIFEYAHPDDVHAALIAFDITLKTRMSCQAKFRYRKASGEYVWLESNCNAVLNKNSTALFQEIRVLGKTTGEKPRVTLSPEKESQSTH